MPADKQETSSNRWEGRPLASWLLRASVFVIPILASIGTSLWLSKALPTPSSPWHLIGWWVLILGASTSVLFLVDKGARKLLPLAALMQITMIFPDKAPTRFKTALKSGSSVKKLKEQLERAESGELDDDLTEATEFILQMAAALNTHDARTRGHAERVRAYADMLAEEMHIEAEDRAKLRWASLLHDIGKLKIPTEILNKPGQLDDEEWVAIKQHPVFGEEICAPLLEWLGPWADTIVDHHERYDGKGYPAGKKGEEISFGGRIVNVADAYDVMTTVRSYKKPMTSIAAREELARHAGGQFDPDVVRAFLNISMGRLRWIAGPLSWLAQMPFLNFLGAVQQVGTAVGVAGLAAAATAGIVGAGVLDIPDEPAPPAPVTAPAEPVPGTPGTPGTPATANTPGAVVAAAADNISMDEDSSTVISVLSNDLFIEGNVVSIVKVPDFGTVVLNGDGTVTYTPIPDFVGSDTFVYAIVDDGVVVDTAIVTVVVGGENDDPIAEPDVVELNEDGSVDIDVLANDTDIEDRLDPRSVRITTPPVNGTAIVGFSGSITYTPDADFAGTDAFVYEVDDLDGGTASATVEVTVRPVNDGPVAAADAATTAEDAAVTVAILTNDSDVDGFLDPSSVAVTSPTAHGTTAVVSGAVIYSPFDNFFGSDAFSYRVCDDAGACAKASVKLTVTSVNDPPLVPGPGPVSTVEETDTTMDLLAGASDIEGDGLSLLVPVTSAAGGVLTDNGDGTVTYAPPVDFFGTDSFSYSVSDGKTSTSRFVSIAVSDVNDAPTVPGPGPLSTVEDTLVSFDPLAGSSDPDGDVVLLSSFDSISAMGGVVVSGSLKYTPPPDFVGVDTFGYVATDGRGSFVSIAVVITVVAANDAPTAVADSYDVPEDNVLSVAAPGILGNDTDIDGDPLSATLAAGPAHGVAAVVADGSFVYTPNLNYTGNDSFAYTVSDGAGGWDTAAVGVVVLPVNDLPVATDDSGFGFTTPEDTPLTTASVTGNDTDVEDGSPVASTTALISPLAPAAAGTLVNNADGTFGFTPALNWNGSASFTYQVKDSAGATTNVATVTLTVTSVNTAPVLDPVGAKAINEGAALGFTATATDIDLPADTLTFSLSGGPTGAAMTAAGVFSWTPTEAQGPGIYSFDVVVTDGGSLSDSETVTVTVNEVNTAPVLDPVGNHSGGEGTVITFDADAIDPDLPAQILTFSLDATGAGHSLPTGYSFDPSSGVFTWTPTEAQGGETHTFAVVVTDDGTPPLADAETIKVAAVEVLTDPVANDDSFDSQQDTPLLIDVDADLLVNDTDADSDPLSLGAFTSPTTEGGTVVDGGGTLTYTPPLGFWGTDSFSYDADDGLGGTDTATVTLNVNGRPVAGADLVYAGQDTPGDFTVLVNDSDPEAAPLTVDAVTPGGAGGATSINPDGSIHYVPPSLYLGPDSFSYTISDPDGGSAVGTVDVSVVAGLADLAVGVSASPDPVGVGANLTYAIGVDNKGPLLATTFVVTTLDASVTFVSATASSGACVHAGGVVTCAVGPIAAADSATIHIVVNPTVNGVFIDATTNTFSLWTDPVPADNTVLTTTAVTGTVAAFPDGFTTDYQTELDLDLVLDLFINDVEPDGDPLTLGRLDTTSSSGGIIVNNGDGTITYTPPASFAGPDWFTYEVCDPLGACDSAPVNVTVLDPVLYLRSGGNTRLDVLPLSFDPPTAALIDSDPAFNYDSSGVSPDADPGLTLHKTPDGVSETEVHKKQWWDISLADPMPVSGPVTFTFWSAQDNYVNLGKKGQVHGFLMDCDSGGGSCVLVASGQVIEDPDWGPANGIFVPHTLDFGDVVHPFATGRTMRLMATVEDANNGRMWFGFDTTAYPASLSLKLNDAPEAHSNPFATSVDTDLPIATAALIANDTDPDLDPLVFGSADVVSVAGGSVVDDLAGTLTYSPSTGYQGLDSFEYQVCDVPFNMCDTATVYVAVGDEVLFLGSNGVVSQSSLPAAGPPTAILSDSDPSFNYDTDRDAFAGLRVKAGGALSTEGDPGKRQFWDTAPQPTALDLTGPAQLSLWSVQDGWINIKAGEVRAYVMDCAADGADCVEVASGSVASEPWGPTNAFVRHDIALTDLAHTIDAGRIMRVMVAVRSARNGKMNIAFDTVDYPSVLTVGLWGPPLAHSDVFATTNDAAFGFTEAQLSANDAVPFVGPVTVTPAVASDQGGVVTDLGGGSYSYQPPLNYSGLDSFSYTLCDAAPLCDTATVWVAVGEIVHFAGSAGTDRVDVLPLTGPPTDTHLPNYDFGEGDQDPGLTIKDTDGSPFPANPEDRQWWDVTTSGPPIALAGPASFTFWAQQDNGENLGKEGWVYAHLADCAVGDTDGSTCSIIATANVHELPDWGPANNVFVPKIADFGEVYHAVPAGRVLRVAVADDKAHNGKMWFAFDTVDYPAVLTVGDNGVPVANGDVFATSTDTPLALTDINDLLGNDTDPDTDPLVVGRVDATSVSGGTVVTAGGPISSVTYTPAAGFTGLDSFTYDACDPDVACSTAVVYVAVGEDVHFLGSAGTVRQDSLPFSGPPTALLEDDDPALNYDGSAPDNDVDPGLTIKDGNALATEIDPEKRQWWDLPVAASSYQVAGPARLTLWSAQDDWQNTADGDVHAYLLDCAADGPSCFEVAFAEVPLGAWDVADGTGYIRKDIDLGNVIHTFDAGRVPRLMVAVDKGHNGKMWFAFDTVDYPAVLTFGLEGGPVAYGDVFSGGIDTAVGFTEPGLIANDIYPGEGTLGLTVAAASAEGGVVTDLGGGSYSYQPAFGFSGLDTFTYDLCDGVNPCDTAIVSVAVGEIVYFLGSSGSTRQDVLPLAGPPTPTLLGDYDTDVAPGLTVKDGNGLSTESDPEKRQWWDAIAAGSAIDLSGETKLDLWSQQFDGNNAADGIVNAYLLDCLAGDTDGSSCTEFAAAAQSGLPWGIPDGEFLRRTFEFGPVVHTIPAGRALRVMVAVDKADGGRMWFALDTVDHPAVLTVDSNGDPTAHDDVLTTGSRGDLVIATAGLLANDVDPDLDALSFDSFDAATPMGASVVDNGNGTLTYSLPVVINSGLDSFAYQSCDPFGGCDTATVWVAVGDSVRFLGSSGTARVASLPLAGVPAVRYADDDASFDYDSDGKSGLSLKKLGILTPIPADEIQLWDEVISGSPFRFTGPTKIVFWSSNKDLDNSGTGDVSLSIEDCNSGGGGCSTVATASVTSTPWDAADGFGVHTADFGDLTAEIAVGRMLRVELTVPDAGGGRMWFAFDTTDYPSFLAVGNQEAPAATADVYSTPNNTSIVLPKAGLLANDPDPDGDPVSVGTFDVATTKGGTVVDNGNGTLTFTPAAGFTGADHFSYQACDSPWNDCRSAMVTVAVGDVVRFLGSTTVGASYDLDAASPTLALGISDPALDYDVDGKAGETIQTGAGGSTEPIPAKRQWWDTASSPPALSGETVLTFWSSAKDLANDKTGTVQAHLMDCAAADADLSTCTEIATGGVTSDPWGQGAPDGDFVRHEVALGDVYHSVAAGRVLRLVVTTSDSDGGRLWVGFDTVDYPSVLSSGFNGTPLPIDDAFATPKDTALPITEALLKGNDSDPDTDAIAIASVDDSGAVGTAVLGGGVVTYTPASGYSGLDEFTYQLCDPYGACGTGTVRVAVGDAVLFLGSAGGARVPVLPLTGVPTATVLADYDGDSVAGLAIDRGATDWDEPAVTDRQWWHITAPAAGLNLNAVKLAFWSIPAGDPAQRGTVWAHLVECDADGLSNCFPIASLALDQTPWSSVAQQARHDIDFGVVGHVVPAGKVLRLVLEAERADGNVMHFGFDTTPYPSVLTIG